jgi:hypothetical protein
MAISVIEPPDDALLRFALKPRGVERLSTRQMSWSAFICAQASRGRRALFLQARRAGTGRGGWRHWRGCVVSPHLMLLSFKTIISEPQRRPKGKTYIPHPAHPLINRLGSDYLSSSANASLVPPTHNLYSHPRSRPRNQAQQEEARTHPTQCAWYATT